MIASLHYLLVGDNGSLVNGAGVRALMSRRGVGLDPMQALP